jgi:hypothetical protein
MNMLGFASKRECFNPESFLEDNIIGLAEIRGFKHNDVRFVIVPDEYPNDLVVGSSCRLSDLDIRNGLPDDWYKMIVGINESLVSASQNSSLEKTISSLWTQVGTSLRIWEAIVGEIPTTDLVPKSTLLQLPDGPRIYSGMLEFFLSGGWSAQEFRARLDATTVGVYIAETVMSRSGTGKRVSEREISDFIFNVRKNNWHLLAAS